MVKTNTKRLSVRETKVMGRGVFAGSRIREGEIIETCPVIPLSKADEDQLSKTVLDQYLFAWGEGSRACLVLGFGSIYNHSSTPNAAAREITGLPRMEFVALRDIELGEQIFIDYQWEAGDYHFLPGAG